MAWFTSHQEFKDDPRTLDLMSEMNWDLDVCIGKWSRLIWWCIDYAEDGILEKHKVSRIAQAIGLQADEGEKFKQSLIASGYATNVPDFRIISWWELMGRFLNVKYKKNPKLLNRIKSLYADQSKGEEEVVNVPGEVPGTPNNTVHENSNQKKLEKDFDKEYNTPPPTLLDHDKRYGSPIQLNMLLSNLEIPIDEESYMKWYFEVQKIIETENATRPNNRFIWSSNVEQTKKEMRTLVYRIQNEEKMEILTKVSNMTGKIVTWLEYLTKVITITVRQSETEPLRNPIGFAIALISQPERVVANPTTGVSI